MESLHVFLHGASLIAQLVKNPPAMQGTLVQFLVWKDLLRSEKATHSSILAWRTPWTTVNGVAKSWTGLSDFHFSFPCGSDSKESACSAEELGSIPGSERFPGEGNGNLLQYSCPENPMDRGTW